MRLLGSAMPDEICRGGWFDEKLAIFLDGSTSRQQR